MNRTVDPASLPSLQQLHRATAAAILVAVTLTVTTVLPAEWGIDPTGIGSALGLTAMGELKQGVRAPVPEPVANYGPRTDEITLTLNPNQGLEVKATMRAGDRLDYTWSTDGGELFYDFHGDPKGGGDFTSFQKSSRSATEGSFEAPFEGLHGWYWKNRTSAPVTVVLKTSGVYERIAQQH